MASVRVLSVHGETSLSAQPTCPFGPRLRGRGACSHGTGRWQPLYSRTRWWLRRRKQWAAITVGGEAAAIVSWARLGHCEQFSQLCRHPIPNKIRVKIPGIDSPFETLMNF
jgi:hypothetical protein